MSTDRWRNIYSLPLSVYFDNAVFTLFFCVAHSLCYFLFMLHFFRVALFSCFAISVLRFVRVVLFSYCTLLMLLLSRVRLFSCSPFSVLDYFHDVFFVLHYFHVALSSFCTVMYNFFESAKLLALRALLPHVL